MKIIQKIYLKKEEKTSTKAQKEFYKSKKIKLHKHVISYKIT
jgi:hypothetical protein